MFCNKCGKEVDEGTTICPYCGENLKSDKKERKTVNLCPIMAVALVNSIIAFIFGFVLLTCSLAKNGIGITLVQFMAIIPAFIGLSISAYKYFDDKSDSTIKLQSIISFSLSAFILLYTFIAYIVQIV